MLPIALQLYSVRDHLASDFYGTLKAVKAMGYDGVELSGLEGSDPLEVKRMLNEVGLIVCSSHAPVAEMRKEGAFARYKAAGCDFIVIPWMSHGEHGERLPQNLETILELAKEAKENGITLLYHNHDFEFKTVNGKTILDTIYDTVPADLLQTQIDTCWVKFAGTDPAAYLRKYAGRAPLVHLKDFYTDGTDGAAPYDLIGKASEAKKASGFAFRPIGYGVQDIPAVLEASKAAGARWVIVEQDESPDRDTLEAAQMSVQYLRSLTW